MTVPANTPPITRTADAAEMPFATRATRIAPPASVAFGRPAGRPILQSSRRDLAGPPGDRGRSAAGVGVGKSNFLPLNVQSLDFEDPK